MNTDTEIRVGDIVTGVPIGQKRRQTMQVRLIEDECLIGLLVSKKFPGDFRGQAVMWTAEVERA